MSDAVGDFKQRARATWAAGRWDDFAELIQDAGRSLVRRLDVSSGERVLDIGAGSGNAAIYAAQAGAEVVASDLTPENFDDGRARASRNGVELEWVEADAEDLPFEDASFDVVMTTFGAMFAPRHEVAAAELARVCKPGGRIGMTTWPPDSFPGRFFAVTGRYMPAPPDFVKSPVLWGDEEHVRQLLAPHGIELAFDRDTLFIDFPSAEEMAKNYEERFGPFVMAKKVLAEQGRWDDFIGEYTALIPEYDEGGGDGVHVRHEYLVTLGTKAG